MKDQEKPNHRRGLKCLLSRWRMSQLLDVNQDADAHLAAHLEFCPQCREEWQATLRLTTALRRAAPHSLRPAGIDRPASAMPAVRWWGIAAAVVVLTLVAGLLLNRHDGPKSQPELAAIGSGNPVASDADFGIRHLSWPLTAGRMTTDMSAAAACVAELTAEPVAAETDRLVVESQEIMRTLAAHLPINVGQMLEATE